MAIIIGAELFVLATWINKCWNHDRVLWSYESVNEWNTDPGKSYFQFCTFIPAYITHSYSFWVGAFEIKKINKNA